MKALSVRPPWAQFIIYGIPLFKSIDNGDGSTSVKLSGEYILKDVENRPWEIPAWFKMPQRIYIHASKRADPIEPVLDLCIKKIGLPLMPVMYMTSPLLGRGAIIGEIELVACIKDSKSPWAVTGQNHLILRNPKPYKFPIPCREARLLRTGDRFSERT